MLGSFSRAAVVKQPQCTRVKKPTSLCNQVDPGTSARGTQIKNICFWASRTQGTRARGFNGLRGAFDVGFWASSELRVERFPLITRAVHRSGTTKAHLGATPQSLGDLLLLLGVRVAFPATLPMLAPTLLGLESIPSRTLRSKQKNQTLGVRSESKYPRLRGG